MGDFVKIAVRTALVGIVIGAILVIFGTITIPSPDFTGLTTAVGFVRALGNHWIPGFNVLYPLALGMFGIAISIFVVRITLVATRFLMKVNE